MIAEISPANEDITSELGGSLTTRTMEVPRHVLVVDDSVVARNQIKKCLESVNFTTTLLKNGAEAHQHLQQMVAEGRRPQDEHLMMISDIEMPEMDGYTLTRKVKEDANLKSFYVLLHTSLSGVFNKNMVQKVGANDFLAKFDANELANAVLRRLEVKQEDVATH